MGGENLKESLKVWYGMVYTLLSQWEICLGLTITSTAPDN